MAGPAPVIGTPAASRAATGAKTSRPWKVIDTTGRNQLRSVSRTAAVGPPSASAAAVSSPLSGPTSSPPGVATATARRAVPTPGSTTPTWTAAGRWPTAWASTADPRDTSPGGTRWVTSMTRTHGACRAITPCSTPANPSDSP
jgi:hypothetical protein